MPGAVEPKPEPLASREFGALIGTLVGPTPTRIAVAVSGGADSMALALLSGDWARRKGIDLIAFTVDHGLRSVSGREARQVSRWLKARGIPCRVLRWQGAKPKSNIQSLARDARYALMEDACRKLRIDQLLLAHHQDDQAETVFMRLLRGSGVDGLSGMAATSKRGGLVLLRPLLDVPKARLVATLKRYGQDWIEDTSNKNDAFLRVRVRAALKAVGDAELGSQRLARTASSMARAREALESITGAFLAKSVVTSPYGFCHIDKAKLLALPAEIALRVLGRSVHVVGGETYAPGLDALERLLATVQGDEIANLGGCRIDASGPFVLVARDYGRASPEIVQPLPGQWDNRFSLSLAGTRPPRGLRLTAAGKRPRRAFEGPIAELKAVERAGVPVLVGSGGRIIAPTIVGERLVWGKNASFFMEFDPERRLKGRPSSRHAKTI